MFDITGCVNRIFVTFCDMSQKAIDSTGYGPRSCGVLGGPLSICHVDTNILGLNLLTGYGCSGGCSPSASVHDILLICQFNHKTVLVLLVQLSWLKPKPARS